MLHGHEQPAAGPTRSLALLLSEGPALDVRGAAARRLLRRAHASGIAIRPVFFHGDAVGVPLAPDAARAWQSLADAIDLELTVCTAALRRRGLALPAGATAPGTGRFTLGGLPAWLATALDADRLLRL